MSDLIRDLNLSKESYELLAWKKIVYFSLEQILNLWKVKKNTFAAILHRKQQLSIPQ